MPKLMKTIRHIIRKEFIQLRRDRRMFFVVFFAPVFQLFILGYAVNLDVRDIPTLVCDNDNTKTSRGFLSEFSNSGYFRLTAYVNRIEDIDRYLDNGKASVAIVIPRGFGDKVIAGKPAQVQVIADGSETTTGTIGLSYASMIVAGYSRDIVSQQFEWLRGRGQKLSAISPELRIWYNPELRSRNFMIPGVLALILMVMTMMLTSLAVVKEKETGTMEQLIVTPIRPRELIIGKLAPFTIIGFIDVILVVLVTTFWFHIPIKGSVPLLFGLCAIFLMTTLGLGLLVSTVSRTQQQAMMTAIFFVMLPMMFLSGFVFPIENMPRIIQFITYLLPLRYFFVIIRGLFLKGVGIVELWDEAVALLILGTIIFSMSVLRFRKKLG
ncbi:MAG: ABC transporter permease [Candidatus Eisenbacteria bacterium]|nr:ABC transporter permease [Candidatus Eisenbacteria bacterium]